MSDSGDRPVSLLLRTQVVLREGTRSERASVHCPIHGGARMLEHCRQCARLQHEHRGHALSCAIPPAKADPAHTAGEALGPNSLALDGETGIEAAAAALHQIGATSAAVVDDHGVVVGQVNVTALEHARLEAAERRGFSRVAAPEVEDVMDASAPTVLESASIRDAARVMLARRRSSVVVVNARGEAVGTLEALDLLAHLLE
jgi:predicted transcriptional regulator